MDRNATPPARQILKAIRTRYLCPTNTRGARIKAMHGDKMSLTIPVDHSLSIEQAHYKAAAAFRDKLDWPKPMAMGWLTNGEYVFVLTGGK